jgi:hypothetical protein
MGHFMDFMKMRVQRIENKEFQLKKRFWLLTKSLSEHRFRILPPAMRY